MSDDFDDLNDPLDLAAHAYEREHGQDDDELPDEEVESDRDVRAINARLSARPATKRSAAKAYAATLCGPALALAGTWVAAR
jgi:hypothetical protein